MNNENFEPEYTVITEEARPIAARKNGFAVAALVLGIISLVCCCFDYFSLILSILAIVFAAIDRKQNAVMNGISRGGLICGIIAAVLAGFSILASLVFAEFFEQFYAEYMQMLEEMMNELETEGGEVIFRILPFLR